MNNEYLVLTLEAWRTNEVIQSFDRKSVGIIEFFCSFVIIIHNYCSTPCDIFSPEREEEFGFENVYVAQLQRWIGREMLVNASCRRNLFNVFTRSGSLNDYKTKSRATMLCAATVNFYVPTGIYTSDRAFIHLSWSRIKTFLVVPSLISFSSEINQRICETPVPVLLKRVAAR